MNDSEIIAQLKREPAAELRRLQRQPYEWKVEHACREPVVTTCDCTDEAFHNAYLRLTDYTEQEYREKLKQESPTVYAARVAAGIYQEA